MLEGLLFGGDQGAIGSESNLPQRLRARALVNGQQDLPALDRLNSLSCVVPLDWKRLCYSIDWSLSGLGRQSGSDPASSFLR